MARPNWTVPAPDAIKDNLRCSWFLMHKTASWFDLISTLPQDEKQKLYGSMMRYQIDTLACGDCVKHAQEYVEKSPPEQEIPSIWIWRFHNVVNRRLNKPEISWDTYKGIHLTPTETVCTSGCGE